MSAAFQKSKKALSLAQRADMFLHLAAMEKAGVPVPMAFQHIQLGGADQARVQATQKWLARGKDIASAGLHAGLFTELEAHVLRAATAAGSPAPTYRRLADNYAFRVRTAKKVRSRLAMPALVFVLALLVQPLPALIKNEITGLAYLWHVARPFMVIYMGYAGYQWLRGWLANAPASGSREALERRLTQLPVWGAIHVRANARDFFDNLALMLEAGLPMFEAFPKAAKTIGNQLIRAEYACVLAKLQSGASLGTALEDANFLGNQRVIDLVKTGEASGTLPEMLFRHAQMESEAIGHFYEQAAAWLPRMVYGALVLWMAYGLLTGHAFAPHLPADIA